MRKLIEWFADAWPLVTKKRMLAAVRVEYEARRLAAERHAAEIEKFDTEFRPFIRKVMALSREWTPNGKQFRVCVDFDAMLIRQGLEWGNDRALIDMLTHRIASYIGHELRTLNMHRFTSPDYPPRSSFDPWSDYDGNGKPLRRET